jgi:hypothetical protein
MKRCFGFFSNGPEREGAMARKVRKISVDVPKGTLAGIVIVQ